MRNRSHQKEYISSDSQSSGVIPRCLHRIGAVSNLSRGIQQRGMQHDQSDLRANVARLTAGTLLEREDCLLAKDRFAAIRVRLNIRSGWQTPHRNLDSLRSARPQVPGSTRLSELVR